MSETEAQVPTTQPIVEDDPTKVTKPTKKEPTRVTKKERTPAQLANDQRLAQLARERKEKKIAEREEEKKNKANGVIINPNKEVSTNSMVFLGLGGIAVTTVVIVTIWFFFLKGSKKKEPKAPELE